MEFKTQIKLLGERVISLKPQVSTEEATKNAFIMPFIKELGYDPFNPMEVTPELVADVGIKKGEKIDYAILQNGQPIILIECKHHGGALNVSKESQLLRYFHTTTAKFSILTNGIEYRFYTDLVTPNKMDEKPFFSFDITDMRDNEIEELKKFHKSNFNHDLIVNTANELKYMQEIKTLINNEIASPSEDFVKHFAKQVYPGKVITQNVRELFSTLIKKSFAQQINDIVTDRLKSALNKSEDDNKLMAQAIEETADNSKVVTTQEELDAFNVVRAVVCSKVKVNRIFFRDAQSYFAILFDDNNRKTICRIYFTEKRKQIGIFDKDKNETRHEIQSIEDIYNFGDELNNVVNFYANNN